ncbi:hypothetical protein Tco_0658851 [Tanacetum coccineum]
MIKAARDRQKSYADKRRKPLEFSLGEYILLKVLPWKGVVRFGKKEKLAPRFVGPFEITKRISPVAYRLKLPEELNGVHETFHVTNFKKCLAGPTIQITLDEFQVDAKLNFVEEHVEILEREFKKLKRSRIAIVKVRWNSKRGPEFTWDLKLRHDTSMQMTEDVPAQEGPPKTQTLEERTPETLSGVMSHALAKDRERSKESGTRLTEKTTDDPPNLKKHTSPKASMTEADIGSPNQKNKNLLMKRTCLNLGCVRKLIRNFEVPKRTRMPTNVKTYDGTGDLEYHLKIFQTTAKIE